MVEDKELFNGLLILLSLPILIILKGKKIVSISYYREQRIMFLGRQNIMLASEDQEEINLYNCCIKNINSKQDVEQGWYSN